MSSGIVEQLLFAHAIINSMCVSENCRNKYCADAQIWDVSVEWRFVWINI